MSRATVVAICCSLLLLSVTDARAGTVSGSYTPLNQGATTNLTSTGTLDWVKWGNGEHVSSNWTTVRKSGGTPFISGTLNPVGTPPPNTAVQLVAFTPPSPQNALLNFNWSNGNGPANGSSRTVITETIIPAQFSYPLGLGARFTVPASSNMRTLDVYVQGFNADMMISASMSGGGTASTVVTPNINPSGDIPNDYAIGRYTIEFSGQGETLTVTVKTQAPTTDGDQNEFPNAGIFAAALREEQSPNPCPIVTAMDAVHSTVPAAGGKRSQTKTDPAATLAAIRRFRDDVLANDADGRRLIDAYYEHAWETTAIIATRPELASRVIRLLDKVAAPLADSKAQLVVDQALLDEGLALSAEIAEAGSPELQDAAAQLESFISGRVTRLGDGLARLDMRTADEDAVSNASIAKTSSPERAPVKPLAGMAGVALLLTVLGTRKRS